MSRNILSMFLNSTAQHERAAYTKDASGAAFATYASQTANVKCAIWPADSQTKSDYLRNDIVVTHKIAADVDLGAKAEDRITIGSKYYLVRGIGDFQNNLIANFPLYVMDVEERIV